VGLFFTGTGILARKWNNNMNIHCSSQPLISDGKAIQDIKKLVLYQYEVCPFCNKVRAVLDFYKIPYQVVEVNPIFKTELGFSSYKKVPIVMIDDKIQLNDSSMIINELQPIINSKKKEIAQGENQEEAKWRNWSDDRLVHLLPPNIYRSPSEALEAFDYITTMGNFNFVSRYFAKYTGALAMFLVAKSLKKKHNIVDERKELKEAGAEWIAAIGDSRPFLGGPTPNLADLSVYGVLHSIEGLQASQELFKDVPNLSRWYSRVQSAIGSSSRNAASP